MYIAQGTWAVVNEGGKCVSYSCFPPRFAIPAGQGGDFPDGHLYKASLQVAPLGLDAGTVGIMC